MYCVYLTDKACTGETKDVGSDNIVVSPASKKDILDSASPTKTSTSFNNDEEIFFEITGDDVEIMSISLVGKNVDTIEVTYFQPDDPTTQIVNSVSITL